MTTRANIYADEVYMGNVNSSAYPVREDKDEWGDSLWQTLMNLNDCTYKQFVETMTDILNEQTFNADSTPTKEHLSTEFGGTCESRASNWSYEYMWHPVDQPSDSYKDWDNWTGCILVRRPDYRLMDRIAPNSYSQIPDAWIPITEWWQYVKFEDALS